MEGAFEQALSTSEDIPFLDLWLERNTGFLLSKIHKLHLAHTHSLYGRG